jgi:hypothetical protein
LCDSRHKQDQIRISKMSVLDMMTMEKRQSVAALLKTLGCDPAIDNLFSKRGDGLNLKITRKYKPLISLAERFSSFWSRLWSSNKDKQSTRGEGAVLPVKVCTADHLVEVGAKLLQDVGYNFHHLWVKVV